MDDSLEARTNDQLCVFSHRLIPITHAEAKKGDGGMVATPNEFIHMLAVGACQ